MLKLCSGDYVREGGGLAALTGSDALLGRILYRLTARRGAFPFLPELGSQLWRLGSTAPGERLAAARQYVAEALEGEDVTVTDVALADTDTGCAVTVALTAGDTALSVTVDG